MGSLRTEIQRAVVRADEVEREMEEVLSVLATELALWPQGDEERQRKAKTRWLSRARSFESGVKQVCEALFGGVLACV